MNIHERYYNSIDDLYRLGDKDILVDSLHASESLSPLMARRFKVMRFRNPAIALNAVALNWNDADNPLINDVIAALKKVMEQTDNA